MLLEDKQRGEEEEQKGFDEDLQTKLDAAEKDAKERELKERQKQEENQGRYMLMSY